MTETVTFLMEDSEASQMCGDMQPGREMILVELTDPGTGTVSWRLRSPKDCLLRGMRYHGWRGTIDGCEAYSCGIRQIVCAGPIRLDDGGYASRTVTVGPDLHPEWE